MGNPFDGSPTTGGRAAQAVYNNLLSDKAYDDESLTPKPGIPFPNPGGVKEPHEAMSQETVVPDYESENLTRFNNNKKICEALDDNLERTFIDPINHKKGEIVTIMTAAEAAIADVNPLANTRLIIAGATAPDTEVVYYAGISTFVYAQETDDGDPATDEGIVGQRGKIFPDILAAFHYPNVINLETETLLPKLDPTFIKVSRTSSSVGNYSNTLGIGQSIYHSGDDNDYAGAVGVVTAQTFLGYWYFFGGTETNNIGANIDVVRSGSATSITNLVNDITNLRTGLRNAIGFPQAGTDTGINTIRDTKTREELEVWYDTAGNRTKNIYDFQSALNSLENNEDTIEDYNS